MERAYPSGCHLNHYPRVQIISHANGTAQAQL